MREAIRKLELEGYVISDAAANFTVANLSIRDVNEVFEIQTSLDSLASGLAAERITDEELERLQRSLVLIGEYVETNDMEKLSRLIRSFTCIRRAVIRVWSASFLTYGIQLTRFRTTSMAFPGRLAATLEEHAALSRRLRRAMSRC